MKKREAVQKTLEDLDREQQARKAEQERIQSNKRQDGAIPSLLKRAGIGLLDFVFMAIVTVGMVLISYAAFFEPLGYNSAVQTIYNKHDDSHLFILESGKYEYISDRYDDSKTVTANYDEPITYYYTNDQRAIDDSKLEQYVADKLASDYYVLDSDNNCVLKDGMIQSSVKTFLETKYKEAVEYFYEDAELNEASKTMFNIMAWTIFIAVSVSSTIFYIMIPMIDKNNRTIGYMIGKMTVANKSDLTPLSKKKLLLRNIMFVVISFVSAVTIYMLSGTLNFVMAPILVNTIVLCITKRNYGIHDLAVESCVINRSLSNEFTMLDNIKKMGGNN